VNQVPPVCEKALEIPPKIGGDETNIWQKKICTHTHTQIEFECLHGFLAERERASLVYLASTQWAHLIIISWLVYCYISVNKELLRRWRGGGGGLRAVHCILAAFSFPEILHLRRAPPRKPVFRCAASLSVL